MPIAIDDALFRPRGIAIVGASNDPDKLSGRPLDYLLRLGYRGQIFPVNPNRPLVQGVSAFASLRDITGVVDLAIVVVPSVSVPAALRDCAAAGVAAAIIFASGFADMGGAGDQLQDDVEEIVRTTGMRILGPNCLGTFCLPTAAFATFSSAFDEATELSDDPIAVVSQSGAVGTFMFSTMVSDGVGLRYYANTGNEADVTVGELLGRLARSDDVSVLIGYLEDARRLDLLNQAAADANRLRKPMILLKAGATAEGARAVRRHTGSRPGDDIEFMEIVSRHGAIRVHSIEEAADAALIFRDGRRCAGRRLLILTISGGAAALATDAAVRMGLAVDEPDTVLQDALRPLLPDFGSTANPIDLTGALLTDPAILGRVLAKVAPDPDVDMILIVMGNADRRAEELVASIHRGRQSTQKPLAVAWSGGSGRPRRALLNLGVPTYSDPVRAIRALKQLTDFSQGAASR